MKKERKTQGVRIGLLGLVLILTGAGCQKTTNIQMEQPRMMNTEAVVSGTMMMEKNENPKMGMDKPNDTMVDLKVDTSVMMEKENTPMEKTMMKAEITGTYESYSPEKIAFASEGDVILFFHAPWCPTCKALDSDINGELSQIPANTKILKVDYDSSSELKKKYGVTYQHTLVQVDAEGNMITKWSGGNTLESILEKIQ